MGWMGTVGKAGKIEKAIFLTICFLVMYDNLVLWGDHDRLYRNRDLLYRNRALLYRNRRFSYRKRRFSYRERGVLYRDRWLLPTRGLRRWQSD